MFKKNPERDCSRVAEMSVLSYPFSYFSAIDKNLLLIPQLSVNLSDLRCQLSLMTGDTVRPPVKSQIM